MAPRTQLQIVQGPQAWRLLRTSRDGASLEDLEQFTAAAVRYFLLSGAAFQGKGAKHELVQVGPNEWRFGPARPLRILSISQEPRELPPGRLLADRQTAIPDLVPTVTAPRGAKPWFINVEFWWRAAPTTVDYPGMREELFGRSYTLSGADWTLDRAVAVEEPGPDPGDASWGDAMGERASDAIEAAGKELGETVNALKLPVAGIAVAGIALWLLLRTRGGRS